MRTSAAGVFGVVLGGLALSCHSTDKDPVAALGATAFSANQSASGSAADIRWDIVSVNIPITTLSPGGVAFAFARNPSTLRIKFTGSGTFVAPASGGTSNAVTGGGTWETFSGAVSTGSGTYWVAGLASWQFANFQLPGANDLIGNISEAANGNAVLRIDYSDGSDGILGVAATDQGRRTGSWRV